MVNPLIRTEASKLPANANRKGCSGLRLESKRSLSPWMGKRKIALKMIGRQSRLSYRLDWSGVTIGLSNREASRRNLNNYLLQISGTPSLLVGALEAREFVNKMIQELLGTLTDEWVRRIDICIDVAGLDLRHELLPAFEEERFITTANDWNPWKGKSGVKGFTVGRRDRVKLNVYDKLLESASKHDDVYRRALIDRRWKGEVPRNATRIEFQIAKTWLDGYGYRNASDVLNDLPSILHKLTGEESKAFIRFTSGAIDRENKHQSRAKTLGIWKAIIDEARRQLGEPKRKLKPIKRGAITERRAFRVVLGLLTKFAANKGEYCGTLEDAAEQLRKLHLANGGTDEEWEAVWERKAREAGTLQSVTDFPGPGDEGIE